MKHFFVSLMLLISSIPLFAFNEAMTLRGAITPVGDVYTVSTAEDLVWVAEASQYMSFEGKTIQLSANLDLSGILWKVTIGKEDMPFQGLFDGQCHAISNLEVKALSDDRTKDFGLFGYIGPKGVVQDLAIASGSVFEKNVNYVGSFAGRNEGTIQRCFNHARVTAETSNYVGGLVGENKGLIDHCYNMGIIMLAGNYSGCITGSNDGTVSNSYTASTIVACTGMKGAVTGKNTGTWENVLFDQQMGLSNAIGETNLTGVTNVAYTLGNPLWAEFAKNDDGWYVDINSYYPQLACFHNNMSDLSLASAAIVNLGVNGVSAQQIASEVEKDFKVLTAGGVSWTKEGDDDNKMITLTGQDAKLNRPCDATGIYMVSHKGSWWKEMYISLKGYKPFDARSAIGLAGNICLGDIITYQGEKIKIYGGPDGGKDDKKDETKDDWMPYYYMVNAFRMIDANNDEVYEDSVQVITDEEIKGDKAFQASYYQPTEPGIYRFYLKAHDSQCQLDWVDAKGYCDAIVRDEFNAGAIDGTPDTIWGGLPKTITISQLEPVSGGQEPYSYLWWEVGTRATAISGEGSTISREFLTPGRYTLLREAKDMLCETEFYKEGKYDENLKNDNKCSRGEKRVVVYDDIYPGSIQTYNDMRCGTTQTDEIRQDDKPTGGTPQLSDGDYTFRWTCNGEVVQGANAATLSLAGLTFEKGKTYTFRREVSDSSGHFPWQQSQGEYTIGIIEEFIVGQIDAAVDTIYGNLPQSRTITEVVPVSGGQGEYEYRWKVNNNIIAGETNNTLTINFTNPGTYSYTREVKDEFCSTDYTQSVGIKNFYVFNVLNAGKINDKQDNKTCEPNPAITIGQTQAPKDGSKPYSYRWYCNNKLVEGANAPTLSLASLNLPAGVDYTFYREVKDSYSKSAWTKSEGEYKIHIYHPFTPGAIKSLEDSKCVDKKEDATLTFTLAEQTAASGDEQINYRWKLYAENGGKRQEIKTYTSEEIPASGGNYVFNLTDFPTLNIPSSLVLVREVQNPVCSAQWEPSEGEVKFMFGRNSYKQETITPCKIDLPYKYTYKFMDGHEEVHEFTADNETYTFDEGSVTGCKDATVVTCKIIPAPEVEVNNLGNICQDETTITIPIKINSGRPSQYRVFFDDDLKALGLEDYEAQLFSPTEVVINTGALPMQEFAIGLQFYEYGVANSCPTAIDSVHFNINLAGFVYQKWNDILYVDNNPGNGRPTAEGDLRFVGFQWYKDGQPIEGATSQYYQEEFGLNGVYYVILTDEDGNVYRSCDIEARPGMGLIEVEIDWNDAATEIYTITGVKLNKLPDTQGVYVVRYNAAGKTITRKITVK